ncbi:MAG: pilus assembly protein PilM, partial [Deltaproteobacteria bacterium]|nr:pilus assembly protein PilM [Deltaproteobacteria bacterium]
RLKSDWVVVSLPGLVLSTRIITLPFTDRRKIVRVIPFEVEGHIPFALEEVVISHHILGQEGGKTRVLAGAVRKDLLRETLAALAMGGVKPRIVDMDFMALFNLSQGGLEGAEGCYAIVDIGASKTSVCVVDGRSFGFGRSIPIGGRAINRAIEGEFGMSEEEAEGLKRAEAFLPVKDRVPSSHEQRRLCSAVESIIAQLLQEIGRTFYAFEAETQKQVSHVFLCGGTARLANLSDYVSEKMSVPAAPLPPVSSLKGVVDPQNMGLMAQAYGLGLRAAADGRFSQVNFLKDEFAFRSEIKGMKGKMVYVGIFLALILALFAYDGLNRYMVKKQRYLELKSEIERVFRETFPGMKQIRGGSQYMRSKTLELRKESRALLSLGGLPATALDLIRGVTEKAPAGVDVEIDTFSFDAEKIRLSGRTDSFESVDRIVKALQGFGLFEKISLSNAKVNVKDNKVDFRLSISLPSPLGEKR